MSTELRVELDAPPIIVPEVVTRSRDVVANIIDLCHTLEDRRDALLASLPNLDVEEIIEVRMSARIVGVWAWLIECACDAEALERVPKQSGRGKVDTNGNGRVAAAGRQAYIDGKGVSTVYKNARIIKTFGPEEIILASGNNLQDKEFYVAASSAPEPQKTLEMFVEKKTDNPFFEPKDAWEVVNHLKQEAEKAKAPKPKKTGPHRIESDTPFALEMAKLKSVAVQAELAGHLATIRAWPDKTVDPDLADVYRFIESVLEWHGDRTIKKDCEAILKIFAADEGTEAPYSVSGNYIVSWLYGHGRSMSTEDLTKRLGLLGTLGMLGERTREGSRNPKQRGAITSVYSLEESYESRLAEIADLETRAQQLEAIERDWLRRIERAAKDNPALLDLLPQKEAEAA
jgi:hypothetical protein